MELVYLWVEEYKNIKNQGFNFSPRFECEFTTKYEKDVNGRDKLRDDSKLEIIQKDYISIFPDNINVTAIVGGNGSGKSNILNSIIQMMYQTNERRMNMYILIYSKKSEHYYQSNIDKFKVTGKIPITKSIIDLNTIFYSILFDFSLGDRNLNNQIGPIYKTKYSIEPSRNYYSGGTGGASKIENQSYNAAMYANAIYFYKHVNKKVIENLKLPNFNNLEYHNETGIGKTTKKNALANINKTNSSNLTLEELRIKIKDISFNSFFDKYHNNIQDEILILFKLRFTNDEGLEFRSLSKGQQQIISYLGIISKLRKRFEKKEILNIFFDEVESTLHPNWQKNFLNVIIQFLEESHFLKNKIKIGLIFATHSPFLLSDLPKENVIFLDKFDNNSKEKYPKLVIKDLKDGNCINVSKHIELKTFGANIHTLLSDGFFMSDGLMGEFAKSKISEIKKFYEMVKFLEPKNIKYKRILKILYLFKIKEFNHIQSIIGEPFLQTIIKNYLDDLHIIFSDDKTLIDRELAELEKRKKYLESLKNAKA